VVRGAGAGGRLLVRGGCDAVIGAAKIEGLGRMETGGGG
jgi:hypothetical protein